MTDIEEYSLAHQRQYRLLSALESAGATDEQIARVEKLWPIEYDSTVGNYTWPRPSESQDLALLSGLPFCLAERAWKEFEKGY